MLSKDRTLLRLHVEAVWGIRLPLLEQNDVELLRESPQPAWKLCAADITDGRLHIWRPDVHSEERAALRLRVNEVLSFSPIMASIAGVSREIAFSLVASPRIDEDAASSIARPLTVQDRPLIEDFDPGFSDDYLNLEKHPFIGVVVDGRLLSLAHSSRRTWEACELGIDTLPEARRRGYALAATILWARAVMQEGLIPIYSALAENTASLHLAEAAGFQAFARAATFE